MSDSKLLPSGLFVPHRTLRPCRHCGAVFERREGVDQHERQCRARVRTDFVSSCLAAGMDPTEAVKRAVEAVKQIEALKYDEWEEVSA